MAIRPQQTHLRHFWCVTCTCSNCASGTHSMAKNPDESRRKEQHNCPYPNCSKVCGKTSYLLAHIGLHTGELDHPKPCTEQVIALISNQHVIMLGYAAGIIITQKMQLTNNNPDKSVCVHVCKERRGLVAAVQ